MSKGTKAVMPNLNALLIHGSQLKEIFGWDESRYKQLAGEGYIPRASGNCYPLVPCIMGLVKYMKEQLAKKNHGLEEKKDKKMGLEVEALEREKKLQEGQLLTLEEWKTLTEETLPPIVQIFSVLFNTEIPAHCTGQPESVIRSWGKKREAQIRRTLRNAEEAFKPAAVAAKRPLKLK